jgi:hypothetical protein
LLTKGRTTGTRTTQTYAGHGEYGTLFSSLTWRHHGSYQWNWFTKIENEEIGILTQIIMLSHVAFFMSDNEEPAKLNCDVAL